MHLEKAHWIIDNADLFIGEGTPIEEWCLLYKRLTRMSIGELTGESVRKDIMARYDRFAPLSKFTQYPEQFYYDFGPFIIIRTFPCCFIITSCI